MITPLELFAVIVAGIVVASIVLPLAALAGYALGIGVLLGTAYIHDAIHRAYGVLG